MTLTTNTDGVTRAPEDLRVLGRRVDDLIRHVDEPTRVISVVADRSGVVAPAETGEKFDSRQTVRPVVRPEIWTGA